MKTSFDAENSRCVNGDENMENYIMAKDVGEDVQVDVNGDAKECLLLASVLCAHILKNSFSECTNAELAEIMRCTTESTLKDMERANDGI